MKEKSTQQNKERLSEKYWWEFEIDWNKRKREYSLNYPEINDESPLLKELNLLEKFPNRNSSLTDFSEKNSPNYREYVELDKLLDSQVPLTKVPEERIFLLVHQMFELTFKQMKFDFEVIAHTLNCLLNEIDDAKFKNLVEVEIPDNFHEYGEEVLEEIFSNNVGQSIKELIEFWQPSVFASNRSLFSSEDILMHLSDYMSKKNFSGFEFAQFRSLLLPASAFQTEQFRTIQKTFGKEKLMEYQLFASHEYLKRYHSNLDAENNPQKKEYFTKITSEHIYDKHQQKVRDWDSFPNEQGNMIKIVNSILSRIASMYKSEENFKINAEESKAHKIEEMSLEFKKYIACIPILNDKSNDELLKTIDFLEKEFLIKLDNDIDQNIPEEIWDGTFILHSKFSKTALYHIINQLNKTDEFLHDENNSFLRRHIKMVSDQITTVIAVDKKNKEISPPGTGGGGSYYLNFMLKLYQQFPAYPTVKKIFYTYS